jgi:RNA polymerase sigma-70 factor (ECF subfamily)
MGANKRWRRGSPLTLLESPAAAAAEAALVGCAKQGSQEAFGQLYARHADEVRAFIYRRVRDAALTEDVAASTWLEAWRSVGRFASDGRRFAPWVIGIARYELTHVARSLRHCSLDELDYHGQPRHMWAESSRSTEDAAIARTELREVVAALTMLPQRRRIALLLQVREGMSNADIARSMGTTPTAVRFLLHRGRRQLREAQRKRRLLLR